MRSVQRSPCSLWKAQLRTGTALHGLHGRRRARCTAVFPASVLQQGAALRLDGMSVAVGAAVGSTFVASLAAVAWTLWMRKAEELTADVLHLERRLECVDCTTDPADLEAFQWSRTLFNIFRFLELDPDVCQQPPFNECRLISLPTYIRSLRIPGNFDWQRAVRTLLVHFQQTMLLPLADAVVEKPQDEDATDPFAMLGGSAIMYSILKDALSPLHLYTIGEMGNLVASEVAQGPEHHCMNRFLDGTRELAEELRGLPNPFVFSVHMPQCLQGLDPDAPPGVATGEQTFPWLPDLATAPVGMRRPMNACQVQSSEILAILFNRLACNSIPHAWTPPGRSTGAAVQLTPRGPTLHTPEDLLAALLDIPGARVKMQIVSRITGLGAAVAIKERGGWAQAPLAIPCRTGIVLLDGIAKSSGLKEIMSFYMHAECCLRLRLGDGRIFRIAWFQGVEGFVGWHPAAEPKQPWQNGKLMEVQHSSWHSAHEFREVVRATTCLSAAVNISSDRLRLPSGGYGYLGVCNDSVAMLQAAMGEPVTQFPCILAGQAKAVISAALKEYDEAARTRGNNAMAKSAAATRAGLERTPCDVVHTPSTMLGAIRRVEAGLPRIRTPYVTIERARGDLKRAREQLLALGVRDEEAEQLQPAPEAAAHAKASQDQALVSV